MIFPPTLSKLPNAEGVLSVAVFGTCDVNSENHHYEIRRERRPSTVHSKCGYFKALARAKRGSVPQISSVQMKLRRARGPVDAGKLRHGCFALLLPAGCNHGPLRAQPCSLCRQCCTCIWCPRVGPLGRDRASGLMWRRGGGGAAQSCVRHDLLQGPLSKPYPASQLHNMRPLRFVVVFCLFRWELSAMGFA